MKKVLVLVAALALAGSGVAQAAETWKGTIGDSMCAMKHEAGKHGDKAGDHKSCVEKCVAGGGEYVFLTKEKAIPIANQSFAALKAHAGHEVMLTGELKDGKITVSKIEMPKAEEKK
jgi:hypothetical protein